MSNQPESQLSRLIMNALRAKGAFVIKLHGGPHTMAGIPDITGCYRGRSLWLETKLHKGNKPTPLQQFRMDQLRKSGAFVGVVHSVQEALSVLKEVERSISRTE